jgi:hypothetical protein
MSVGEDHVGRLVEPAGPGFEILRVGGGEAQSRGQQSSE